MTSIEQYIKDNIYTNTRHAISGDLLQTVLLAIVSNADTNATQLISDAMADIRKYMSSAYIDEVNYQCRTYYDNETVDDTGSTTILCFQQYDEQSDTASIVKGAPALAYITKGNISVYAIVWLAEISGNLHIYRMIDQYGNDLPYDFYNKKINGKYTFDANGQNAALLGQAKRNVIKADYSRQRPMSATILFSNTDAYMACDWYDNTFDVGCASIYLPVGCQDNHFAKNCHDITLLPKCINNIFERDCNQIQLTSANTAQMSYYASTLHDCRFGVNSTSIILNFVDCNDSTICTANNCKLISTADNSSFTLNNTTIKFEHSNIEIIDVLWLISCNFIIKNHMRLKGECDFSTLILDEDVPTVLILIYSVFGGTVIIDDLADVPSLVRTDKCSLIRYQEGGFAGIY